MISGDISLPFERLPDILPLLRFHNMKVEVMSDDVDDDRQSRRRCDVISLSLAYEIAMTFRFAGRKRLLLFDFPLNSCRSRCFRRLCFIMPPSREALPPHGRALRVLILMPFDDGLASALRPFNDMLRLSLPGVLRPGDDV